MPLAEVCVHAFCLAIVSIKGHFYCHLVLKNENMLCQLYVIVHFQDKFTSNSDRDSTYIETDKDAIDLVEPGRSVEKHIHHSD